MRGIHVLIFFLLRMLTFIGPLFKSVPFFTKSISFFTYFFEKVMWNIFTSFIYLGIFLGFQFKSVSGDLYFFNRLYIMSVPFHFRLFLNTFYLIWPVIVSSRYLFPLADVHMRGRKTESEEIIPRYIQYQMNSTFTYRNNLQILRTCREIE